MSPGIQIVERQVDGSRLQSLGIASVTERVPRWSFVLVSGALALPGTSSAGPTRVWQDAYVADTWWTGTADPWYDVSATVARLAPSAESTRRAISELRRLSGLTWEQLAELFGVSRRSVHFWASGKPLNAANEEKLLRVLDIVRRADLGSSRSTRAALFNATNGVTAFGLLVASRFEEVSELLGGMPQQVRRHVTPLGPAAVAARRPLSPDALVDAEHEPITYRPAKGRAARVVRIKPDRA